MMQRQPAAMTTTESRAGLIRSSRAFESAKRNASGVLFEPCPPSGGTCGSGFRSSGPGDSRTGRGGGRAVIGSSTGRSFRFAKEKQHHNNNNHWQHRIEDRDEGQVSSGRREKSYRFNGSEYNQNVNGSTEHLFSNKSLIESATPLKSLRTILKQFDIIEKRQWPNFLHDLTLLFRKPAFVKVASEKTHRIVDDCTRIFSRILTTKLFPDITDGMVHCLSALSVALKFGCKELFNWMFSFYEQSSDETKHVLLKALVRIIQTKSKGVNEHISSLMSKLKMALEETDSRILLLELTEIFMVISQSYPSVFQSNFYDVVDILIAWHLDSALDPTLVHKLTQAFVSFQKFWTNDLISSQTLLRNFIEDFELNIDQFRNLQSLKSSRSDPCPILMRMAALVEVYVTVFRSLGPDVATTTNIISWDFVMNSLLTVLSTVTFILKNHQMHEHLAIACNDCTMFTIEQVELFGEEGMEFILDSKDNILQYLDCLIPHLPKGSVQFVVTTLRLQIILVKTLSANLPVEFVTKVMSNAQSLRLMPSEEIHSSLYELHHAMLSVKTLPLLQEAYRVLLSDLQDAMTVLTGEGIGLTDQTAVALVIDPKSRMSSRTAMIVAKSTLISLTELGNARGSLIGMWALKPTFFDLILDHMNPSSGTISKFADLQFMILTMLLSHARKHHHFITSSSILKSTGKSATFTSMIEAPTSGHLSRILHLLSAVLKREKISHQNRLLCLKWATEILSEAGTPNVPLLIQKAEMVQLLEIVSTQSYAKNADIALTSCAVLKLLMQSVSVNQLPAAIQQTYFDACLFQAINFDHKVRAGFEKVLPYLGYKCEVRHELNLVVFNRDEMFYPEDVFMAKLSLMKREQNNSFSAASFQQIMGFILNGSGDESFAWLQRILRSSINDEAPLKQPTLMFKTQGRFQSLFGSEQNIVKVFESNESALMFWATWEVVSYCIANKLKTPLGKAQDLLTKIGLTFQQLSGDDCLLPLTLVQVKMLLILMENLDKQIHNAIHGSGFRIGAVSKVAKTFFITNKATCFDWLARSRLSVMQVAAKSCEPELVWRNGIELVRELMNRKSLNDIESYLILIVEALVQLKDKDSIIGLMVWAKSTLGLTCHWMKPAIKEASGRFESAASGYEEILKDRRADSPIENSKLADYASRRVVESYLSVGSYEEARSWSRKSCSPDLAAKVQACSLTDPADWSEINFQPFDMRRVFRSSMRGLTHAVASGEGMTDGNSTHKLKLAADVRDCLKMTLACGSDYHLNKWLILNRVAERDCGPHSHDLPLDLLSGLSGQLDPSELTQLLRFCRASSGFHLSAHVDPILCAIETVRRSENLMQASKLFLELCGTDTPVRSLTRDTAPLLMAMLKVTNSEGNDLSAVTQLKIVREGCELIKSLGDVKTAADVLLTRLMTLPQCGSGDDLRLVQSECLVTLAKNMEADLKLMEQSELKASIHSLCDESLIPAGDKMITGRLLEKACQLDPKSSTAKLLFGNWAYSAGKQMELGEQVDGSMGEETTGLNCYRLAAQSLFSYLAERANAADDTNITVTLKLMRIITKHSADNQQLLREGVQNTPTAPWRSITIQLFAHLTQSQDDFVKKLISELLCRIGQETPHLIVFPAVSGSLTESESRLLAGIDVKVVHADGESFSNPDDVESSLITDEYELSRSEKTARSSSCFADIVEVLSSYNSQLISETVQFIREMRRIAVLSDELWTGTLLSCMSEVKKKAAALEEEVWRMNNTDSNLKKKDRIRFMKVKYDNSFSRIIRKLTEVKALTVDSYPETPYEKWFQSTFGKVITSTLISLKNPEDYENPQHAFVLFQQLLQSIQKRSLELATSKSQLVMDTISPTLSSFTGTVVPVPGVKSNEVTISKISKTVTILHTKTKPKKVCFYGSSGESHYFLFKGHEDLHLDERIMQFLEIVNKMFVKRSNRNDADVFKARYYSVTPLGSKSGLIEWVDGGPPLFGFYKRWLMNRPVASASTKSTVNNNENACKPSEIFAAKLQDKGLNPENRSSWPREVLMQIHKELSDETCDQLISRELWFSSTSAQDFYRLTKAFTRSNAVMAMIGYVLGLGDRHLDNILLDLSTGEIIHVDYNICFEKGKTLHVPEKVPCRLTKSIVSAFGLTGVEGTFRLSCEQVLSIMRKEKDTLLLLLEAFVSDPLVEWNSISFDSETKKNMAGMNPYAFKVWRKIKHKLEGRDPDSSRRLSVQDQVDYVIKQATDMENLSLMFEGWTSWV